MKKVICKEKKKCNTINLKFDWPFIFKSFYENFKEVIIFKGKGLS